jgi:hypothetical protein
MVTESTPPAPPAHRRRQQNQRNEREQAAHFRSRHAWDNLRFIEMPMTKLSRAVFAPAGSDVHIAFGRRAPTEECSKIGLLRRELTVPDFNVANLTTSSVILATAVEPQDEPALPSKRRIHRLRPDENRAVMDRKFLKALAPGRLLDLRRGRGIAEARRAGRVQLPSASSRG